MEDSCERPTQHTMALWKASAHIARCEQMQDLIQERMNRVDVRMVQTTGIGGRLEYKPEWVDPEMQAFANKCRVRVLTEHDLQTVHQEGTIKPAPFLAPNPAESIREEQIRLVLSMLRLSENCSRPQFTQACVDAQVLPPIYGQFKFDMQRATAVPGCVSSGSLSNLLPLMRTFLTRLDGLHVGRMHVFVFQEDAANPGVDLSERIGEFIQILETHQVPSEIVVAWSKQIKQCIDTLTEKHHYEFLNVQQACVNGTGFLMSFADTPLHLYATIAQHAARRSLGLPHGGTELYAALGQMVKHQCDLVNNATLKFFPRDWLARVVNIHTTATLFHVESGAYRDAPKDTFNEVLRNTLVMTPTSPTIWSRSLQICRRKGFIAAMIVAIFVSWRTRRFSKFLYSFFRKRLEFIRDGRFLC